MFVCWFVGLLVCFLSATRHLSTLRRCLRVAERAGAVVAGGPARARAQACTARARASMPYNFSTKISYADAFQKQDRTRALVGADLGQLVYTYKRVVCVCWFVCLSSFYRPHDICPLCGAASECPRAAKPSRAAPRERASACTARAGARMPYNFSTRKSLRCADAFQKQNRTRAHAVVYVTAEIFNKREKENQHATSQVQFTVCLLLECLLFESY